MNRFLKQRHAHFTVTIPRDLKSQMERYGAKINWSKVARIAFQSVVDAIDASKQKTPDKRMLDGLGRALGHFRRRNMWTNEPVKEPSP